jgi:hypothetical protein
MTSKQSEPRGAIHASFADVGARPGSLKGHPEGQPESARFMLGGMEQGWQETVDRLPAVLDGILTR